MEKQPDSENNKNLHIQTSLYSSSRTMKNRIKKPFKKSGLILLGLLFFAGIINAIIFLGFDGGFYQYQSRIETRNLPKTTFTYYFYWYDNNSGGDAAQAEHVYFNPAIFSPNHPYYRENLTLINNTIGKTISKYNFLYYNISRLMHTENIDFDMLQTHIINATDNVVVLGLNSSSYSALNATDTITNQDLIRYGQQIQSGTSFYHRLLVKNLDLEYLFILNQNSEDTNVKFECRFFNDTLSHHPDGNQFEGDFSYRNIWWHIFEIESIMKAHIDVILPVYWGHWSGDFNINGTKTFVKALEFLENKYGLDSIPKVAMFMDTTSLMAINNSKADLTDPFYEDYFCTFINEFYQMIPSRFRYEVNNDYLVWMYTASFLDDFNDQTFITAEKEFNKEVDKFHGLTFIGSGFTSDAPKKQIGAYSWGVSLNGAKLVQKGIPVGCVGPGFYSEGAVRAGWQVNEGLRVRERDNGEYLIESVRKVERGAKWLVFEVWNEFHEGNDLSYTLEYKDYYINLTAQLVDEFKSSSFIDWQEQDNYLFATIVVGFIWIPIIHKTKRKKLEEKE